MANKDYYGVLGVGKDASDSDIKAAFRKMARQYHPDVNKDKGAQDKFKEVNEAYQVLSDSSKRQRYDQFGSAEGFDFNGAQGGGFSGDYGDIFSNFGDILEGFGFGDIFGQRGGSRGGASAGSAKKRGEDIRTDVSVTLEEAAKGVEKELNIRHLASCDSCQGTGSRSKKAPEPCHTCGGRGEVRQARQSILGTISTVTTCPTCHGEGRVVSDPCPSCSGSGRAATSKTLKVKIPAGIETNSKLRVTGEGNVGQRGGSKGDLYVYIEVRESSQYERHEDDLHSSKSITFAQAALGDEVDVETIFGTVKLKVPAGTQNGTTFRLKGKGMPHLGHHGQGDQLVAIIIEVPKSLSNEERTVIEFLSFLRKENATFSRSPNIQDRMKKLLK